MSMGQKFVACSAIMTLTTAVSNIVEKTLQNKVYIPKTPEEWENCKESKEILNLKIVILKMGCPLSSFITREALLVLTGLNERQTWTFFGGTFLAGIVMHSAISSGVNTLKSHIEAAEKSKTSR